MRSEDATCLWGNAFFVEFYAGEMELVLGEMQVSTSPARGIEVALIELQKADANQSWRRHLRWWIPESCRE